ncbi:MAG TPA: recombinase family protein [Streptosporangiaceae bacterium]
MNPADTTGKVTASRLRRDAYLYIRQSTLYQVANNTESTARQYDLRGRAAALGWPAGRIHVIDIDQGHSGASAADREGFQHLVAEVSMGKAGIVLGLECSRLARNNADWHQLLRICAHNDCLILDEDGLYDPASFNDRLLLGMKGQLSEAELHFLRSRLRGGILAKARRGELRLQLPIGLVYDPPGQVTLDPDAGVRGALSLLFETFTATSSAFAVVKTFRDQQLSFPGRHRSGPRAGELYWNSLSHDQVLKILHNPAYAGAYAYGRARHTTGLDGRHHTLSKPIDEWTVLIHDHHPGYLTWPRYQASLQVLAGNAAARGQDRNAGPPREGPALLQGLVVCGRCGRRMTVRYHTRADGTIVPDYVCQNDGIRAAQPICQHIGGAPVDTAISELILRALTPLALETAITVSDELIRQAGQADAIRAAHVQRAQHAADQARRRYLAVDPGNRLVADALEADWNARLRELAAAQDDYATAKTAAAMLDEQQRARIRALAADFPALWNNPATPMRERKRLIRLLITDVTLTRGQDTITAAARLPGGQHHTLHLPIPLNAWQERKTPATTITLIDQLLGTHTYSQVASALSQQGLTSGDGKPWDADRVRAHCHTRHIPSLWQRLRDAGMLTLDETARQLGAHPQSIKRWYRLSLITGHLADDRGTCLYHPGQARPGPALVEAAGKALGDTHRSGRSHHPGLGGPLQPPRNVSTPRDNHISDTT